MGQRLDLHALLLSLLGTENVYFQPPTNTSGQLQYPAIIYNRWNQLTGFADNAPYTTTRRWRITVIDADPDSLIPDKVAALPMSTYVRHFVASNLNHDVYDVYF